MPTETRVNILTKLLNWIENILKKQFSLILMMCNLWATSLREQGEIYAFLKYDYRGEKKAISIPFDKTANTIISCPLSRGLVGGKAALLCFPFLYDIIMHPTGGTQLANTQIALICSKCAILALVRLFFGRADSSHAVLCTLVSFSLCPPWGLSWNFGLDPVHLGR